MAKRVYDLGTLLGLEAEALGVPGQRTFRVNAHSRNGAARLWVEKEQLQQLASTIEQLLVEVAQARGFTTGSPSVPFPGTPSAEFHVGRITLGYDQDADLVTMIIFESVPLEEEEPDLGGSEPDGEQVRFQASRELAQTFSRQALDVVAAGRPRCPLCGAPLDGPTHFCPRSNGHAPLPSDEE
jgi:uncharacterized repeat protein (TIGR03847 family)